MKFSTLVEKNELVILGVLVELKSADKGDIGRAISRDSLAVCLGRSRHRSLHRTLCCRGSMVCLLMHHKIPKETLLLFSGASS